MEDGSQAISDVCYSKAFEAFVRWGNDLRFEMDDSIYKGPKWKSASPMPFKEGGGVDIQKQNIISIMPAPLCHCPPYNSESRGST